MGRDVRAELDLRYSQELSSAPVDKTIQCVATNKKPDYRDQRLFLLFGEPCQK